MVSGYGSTVTKIYLILSVWVSTLKSESGVKMK